LTQKIVEFSHGIFSIEDLAAMSLTGHGYRSLSVQVLKNERMISEPPFLFPRQYARLGEIKENRYLGLHFIDVLTSWTT
jgi:hypothetical protein